MNELRGGNGQWGDTACMIYLVGEEGEESERGRSQDLSHKFRVSTFRAHNF